MKTKEKSKLFNSLLDEKCIFNEKINKVYELTVSENYDEALYELEKINKRYPYMVDVYHLRFKIYCIKEKFNLAEKVLREAETFFMENEKIKEDRIYFRKVKQSIYNKYLKDENFEMLASSSEEEISNNNSNNIATSTYYYRALSYRMLNNKTSNGYYTQACKVYDNLTKKKESDLTPYLYKALCLKDTKKYGEALKIVNNILQKDCENKEALKIKISIVKELKNSRA